ncbi:MAG TPA: MFS transporter, partial [Mizugakiibacter sp.]|nr:MFS transporter [Mizugakiibacter sp.]
FRGLCRGGGFLVLAAALVLTPQAFGFSGVAMAVRFSFALAALWWLVFTLPLLRWVPRVTSTEVVGAVQAARQGLRQFRRTLQHVASYRQVWMFLIAYWLYIDGVNTVIQMAVDYGKAIGLSTSTMILAVLLVQFIGMPAALVFGRLGERIGPRSGILAGLVVYIGVSVYATQIHSAWQFYVMAAAVGLVQGGVQLLSRALYARLVPKERSGEFFGFYNMLGEFAAILGPLLIGLTSYLTRDPRLSILSVIVLFVLGGVLLLRVGAPTGPVPGQVG